MKIQVLSREVYGRPLIYPVCANAMQFAQLLGRKTIPKEALIHIQNLGFTIEVVADVPTILEATYE